MFDAKVERQPVGWRDFGERRRGRQRRGVDQRTAFSFALRRSVSLHPLPDRIVTQVLTARSYHYGIVYERHVVVDPGTRRIIHTFE